MNEKVKLFFKDMSPDILANLLSKIDCDYCPLAGDICNKGFEEGLSCRDVILAWLKEDCKK